MKNKKGFSLIEILIVLAISISLIAFVYVIFKKVKISEDANSVITDVNVISQKYKSLYLGRTITYDQTVSGTDDNSSIFDYVTKGTYAKKKFSLAGSSTEVYMNKTSIVSLNNAANLFNINLIVDRNLCEKVINALLATGNYIITPDTMSGNSKSYVNASNQSLATLPKNVLYTTSYNQTMLTNDCNNSVQPELASMIGGLSNDSSMSIIVIP